MGRTLVSVVLGAIGAATLVVVALWIWSELLITRSYPLAPETARAGPAQMATEGRRLAKLYGCTSCHGADLQGKVYNPNPRLVRNYAPNLTLAAARYSDEQLAQAIRQGVRPSDGRALWGMPAQTLMHLTAEEMSTVLAFIRAPIREVRSASQNYRAGKSRCDPAAEKSRCACRVQRGA